MSLLANRVDAETMAEINITPFTDVLLVLLIIFMLLAALVTPPGFEKSFSNGCNCHVSVIKHPAIDVQVTQSGKIFVGTQAVSEDGLYNALGAIARRDVKTEVRLTADVKSPYRIAIRVLDAAKYAGLDNVALVTQ